MATADRVLALKLIADVNDANKGLKKTEGTLKGMGRSALSWGKALTAGLVVGGIEMVSDALGDAWAGFRSGQQVSAQLKTTWDNLGLAGEDYAKTLDAISASTIKLGTSDDEAVQVFNDTLKRTKDSDEAMRRLAIAQDLAASKGISLSAAMRIVDKAADGSARTVREFGLEGKTASERLDELADSVKGAADKAADLDPLGMFFNGLAENLETIVGSLGTGDIDGALQGLADMGGTLSTAWDGIAPKITATLDGLTGGKFSEGVELVRGLADEVLPKLQGALDATLPFIQSLIGAAQNLVTFLQPVIDILVGVGTTSIQVALDIVTGALQAVTDLLNGDFDGAWTAIQETVGNVIDDVVEGIDSILPALQDIVGNVASAAGDIGQGIVDGIVNLVKDIPDKVLRFIRNAINGMINLWNSIGVIGAGKIDLLSWGEQGIAGTPFHIDAGSIGVSWGQQDIIPNLPKLAKGGIAYGPTLAMIGEGAHPEAVVPLDGRSMGNTYNLYVTAPVGSDPASLGQYLIRLIQAAERRNGKGWRN